MNIGALKILAAATVFGTAGLFVKTMPLPVTTIACFRLLVPATILLITRRDLFIRLLQRPNKLLLLASLCTAARILLWVLGFIYAPMTQAIVILFTWPLFLSLFSAVFLKEKVTTRTILLLLIAFGGILLFVSPNTLGNGNKQLIGMACMLGVAILNAIVLTIFKKGLKEHEPLEVLFYDNFIGALIFLPFLILNASSLTLASTSYAVLYGFVIGYLAAFLLYSGLAQTKAATASVLSYIEVLVAAVCGVVVFGDSLRWQMLVGGLMILLPAALVKKTESQKQS